MPTEITPQTKAEIGNCLTTLGISMYQWGGKYKSGFQTFQELCMEALAQSIWTNAPGRKRQARGSGAPRTGARARTSQADTMVEIGEPAAPRARGRPRGSTNAAQRTPRGTGNTGNTGNTALVLSAVSSLGTARQALMANPVLKAVRPNHVGIAINRLIRAGKISEREGVLYNLSDQRAAA